MPVEDSIAIERMADAPRRWMNAQRAGVWLLFLSYALSALAIMGEVFAPYIAALPRIVFVIMRTLPLVMLAISVWLLTIQRADRRPKKSSLLVRWGFVGVLALSVILPTTKHAGFELLWSKLGWTVFFGLLVICWIGLGCIQIRISRMLGIRWIGPAIWAASILWSIGLLSAATYYLYREYFGKALFSRAETSFVGTLLFGGLLLVVTSFLVALNFNRSHIRGQEIPTKA